VASLVHHFRQGAYAQFQCYAEADLLKLPDSISFLQAASFELLKCVLFRIEQFGDLCGNRIAICGLGSAGLLAMQAAKLMGAAQLIGVDIQQSRRYFAKELNLGEVMHPDELAKHKVDFGYECVGAAQALQALIDHPTIVQAGILQVRVPLVVIKQQIVELMNKGLNTVCLQASRQVCRA
jgi:threonine dehydrogenase-like Zn-dependent dehydrogenase